MDVKNSFLQGEVEEEVYMLQSSGFESRRYPHVICQLKKSMCSLNQALRAWHTKITQYLDQIGFRMSQSNNSLYTRNDTKCVLFILLYMDDLVIGRNNLVAIQNTKLLLSSMFKMKDLGEFFSILGIEVVRTSDGLLVTQRHYELNLLFKFGKIEGKPISTPLHRNLKLTRNCGEPGETTMYRKIIGNLIYLTITQLDLTTRLEYLVLRA